MKTFLCFPCGDSSTTQDLSEPGARKESDHALIEKPTTGEYAIEGGKDFLRVLEAVAEAVPVPGLAPAVKLATNIIKACEESHATLERAQELKSRISKLVLVLVNQVKGKKAEEIQDEILKDIETLKADMKYIEDQLGAIACQNRLLVIFFRGINEDKVRQCFTRLDTSLVGFSLARDIEQTGMLAALERQIIEFHTQQQRSLDNLQYSMDHVTALLEGHSPGSHTTTRATIPPNTAIFHGRDAVVSSIVNVITGPSRRHVCLLGPGGMGKTSTSLAVMENANVQAKFPNDLRVWVPCVKATGISIFLDTLHTSLGISTKSGNPLTDIVSDLKKSAPIIVLLDNFETPWMANESEVDEVLRTLNNIPHITLFITMRASKPPCNDLPWKHIDLEAVDSAAARDIYTSWYPESRDDPDVPGLLSSIGNMPLAVMLMAKMAEDLHLSVTQILEEYNKHGTQILGDGSKAESRMDICIGLSVNNARMKAHPEALTLLCILSMLPVGTTYTMLSRLWAKDLPKLTVALKVLKSSALVEEKEKLMVALDVLGSSALVERKETILSVLPVIQRYIRDPSRFPLEVQTSMIQKACAFLTEHTSVPGNPKYQEDIAALSTEDGNLEAVLLTTNVPDPQVIRDGLLALARHQHRHRPRVDIIEHAKRLSSSITDNILQGDILYRHGTILQRLCQNSSSASVLRRAIDLFLTEHNDKKVVECRLELAETLRFCNVTRKEKEGNLKDAQAGCIGDEGLTGQCLYQLGKLHHNYKGYPAALAKLMQAEPMLKTDPFVHADCCQVISWTHYKTGAYDSADKYATSALEELSIVGDRLGSSFLLYDIGMLHSARGDYEGSLKSLFQNLEARKSLGLPPLGLTLELMGIAWVKLGKIEDARRAFEEAAELYTTEDDQDTKFGGYRVQFFLNRLDNPMLDPTFVEQDAFARFYVKDHIEKILAP